MRPAARSSKVLAICLDGYEHSLAEDLMRAGELPAMRALAERSARFVLDHGADLRTGLAGEHVATGLSPEAAGRWAAVHFDPRTYAAWQQGTALRPFPAAYAFRTVVLDAPYFNLAAAPDVRGFVSWGAHDPGVPPSARPAGLLDEIEARFGPYPAEAWIYGTPWNSVERSKEMGERLAAAVRQRSRVAVWLLGERLRDWDFALLTVSEAHSAIEGLWHGVDPQHPLHGVPSSGAARAGVRAVYKAIDDLVADVTAGCPDAAVVLFSMHGMGANGSDAASMFLLGELLFRDAFGSALHAPIVEPRLPGGVPALEASETWRSRVLGGSGERGPLRRRLGRARQALARRRVPVKQGVVTRPLDWMPVAAYRPYWPKMPAFALPSFYDGRIRINLAGREARGSVRIDDYAATLDRLSSLLGECVDPLSGRGVVKEIERIDPGRAMRLDETQADLVAVWDNAPLGLTHPELGTIGPIPYRRTGGHTGKFGFAYFAAAGLETADGGVTSAYDVVPSILDLLGERDTGTLSGRSVFASEPRIGAGHGNGAGGPRYASGNQVPAREPPGAFRSLDQSPEGGFVSYRSAVAVALCGFLAFVAMQWLRADQASPSMSLGLASAIAAGGAGMFAYHGAHRQRWVWALVLSGPFWLFLIFAFLMFLASGELRWWPLADAAVIVSAAYVGAHAGSAYRQRTGGGRHAEET